MRTLKSIREEKMTLGTPWYPLTEGGGVGKCLRAHTRVCVRTRMRMWSCGSTEASSSRDTSTSFLYAFFLDKQRHRS